MANGNKPIKRRRRWRHYRDFETGIGSWQRKRRRAELLDAARSLTEQQQATPLLPLPPPVPDTDDCVQDDPHVVHIESERELSDEDVPEYNSDTAGLELAGEVRETTDMRNADSTQQGDDLLTVGEALNSDTSMVDNQNIISFNPDDIHLREKNMRVVVDSGNMSAISTVLGTSRMTVLQYGTFRSFTNYRRMPHEKLPSYPTILYTVYPALFNVCFAAHIIVTEKVDISAAGVTTTARSEFEAGKIPTESMLLVLPSSWASRDARCSSNDVVSEQQQCSFPRTHSILNSLIIQRGDEMSGAYVFCETTLNGSFYEYGKYLFSGDLITITFTIASRAFNTFLAQSDSISRSGRFFVLQCVIGESRIESEGTIGDGLGDVHVHLQTANAVLAALREVVLCFRGVTWGSAWSSVLLLSGGTFVSQSARVNEISLLSRGESSETGTTPALGTLQDGRTYLRVPYILFSDDFSSVGGRGGSYGGCYFAPLLSTSRGVKSVPRPGSDTTRNQFEHSASEFSG